MLMSGSANIFEVASHISTPLAALTFIVAVVAGYAYRVSRTKVEMIEKAPPEARAELVDKALETYHIVDDNLSPLQKYKLMLAVLNLRAKRMKLLSITTLGLSVVIVAASLGIWIINGDQNGAKGPQLLQEQVIRK
jgi:hypothetical protein